MTPDKYTNQEFFLDVGDGHQLYVQDWGKKDAQKPIMFLHGGPGAACHDSHRQNFDPRCQRVIFFDQRGSGKSLPKGELNHNTTKELVDDISNVADRLKLSTFILFGRSWGSCLALNYAVKNPQRIEAIVTGGISLGTQSEQHIEEKAERQQAFFPDAWEKLLKQTPTSAHKNPISYHLKQILEPDQAQAKSSAYTYSEFILAMIRLDDRPRVQDYETFDWSGIKIEAHYKTNNCFLEDDFILKHAPSLTLPIWIVQGRYDILCIPKTAYELHQKLPNSQLLWTVAGHSGSDRAVQDVTHAILLQVTGE